MAKDSEVISVDILGTTLQLRGGDDPEKVRRVCSYVRDCVEKVTDQAPTMPSVKAALYAAINIADDLLEQTEQMGSTIETASEKAYKILDKTGHIDT